MTSECTNIILSIKTFIFFPFIFYQSEIEQLQQQVQQLQKQIQQLQQTKTIAAVTSTGAEGIQQSGIAI